MRRIVVLSFGNFFSAAYYFLAINIVAPYLATLMPGVYVGLAISLSAVVTLSLFPFMPGLVQRYGTQRLSVTLASIEVAALIGLALLPHAIIAVILIAILVGMAPFISYQLDLMLEAAITDERSTGRLRTFFISGASLALMLAPLVTGLILGDTNRYWMIFLLAAVVLVPFIAIMRRHDLPQAKPPRHVRVRDALRCMLADRDLHSIGLAYFTLQFFFHIAPLYIPLYLHTELGIPWSQLGWMFSIMLLPFLALEYPAGWLADRVLGDKRLLAAGFVITGLAFAGIGLITTTTPLLAILAILVLSRTGAALVEAMTEGHFFRRVTSADANTVSLFRMLRPIGALTAPLIGTVLLITGGYVTLFLISGVIILLFGLLGARTITDNHPAGHIDLFARPPFPPHGAPKARG